MIRPTIAIAIARHGRKQVLRSTHQWQFGAKRMIVLLHDGHDITCSHFSSTRIAVAFDSDPLQAAEQRR